MARRKAIHIGRADRFTSDSHFGHQFILQHRPFGDINQHDEHLIRSWNRVVGKTDVVYHLGDFSHPRVPLERRQAVFDRLKGRKVLLVGNHDDAATEALGWDAVHHGPIHFRDGLGQLMIALHWPLEEWDAYHRGSVHLHGHRHGSHPSSRRRFDIGVDVAGSFPLTWTEIKDRMANLPDVGMDGRLIEPWKPDRGYVGP